MENDAKPMSTKELTSAVSTLLEREEKGARGRVLASVMVGGVRYTTVEAVRRFLNNKSSAPHRSTESIDAVAIDEALRQAGV